MTNILTLLKNVRYLTYNDLAVLGWPKKGKITIKTLARNDVRSSKGKMSWTGDEKGLLIKYRKNKLVNLLMPLKLT